MTRKLRLLAPAKINWTLEVLRRRPDGYHEIRSILQTIDLCDIVTLTEADDIELVLSGPESAALAGEPAERNLAVRAARALQARISTTRGVRIEIEKHIPVAAGLGGGSSDAGALLRGCNVLWDARQDEANLIEIAGEVGSDPPFFIVCGTASVSGRGEIVRTLPDASRECLLLATPNGESPANKTASMYTALDAASDFSDGAKTQELGRIVEADGFASWFEDDALFNAFDAVASRGESPASAAFSELRELGCAPHLAGSGPSFVLLLDDLHSHKELFIGEEDLAPRIAAHGYRARDAHTMKRNAALKIEEL